MSRERFPNESKWYLPSDELFNNPHKGFTTFQRCRGDILNENRTLENCWEMELIPPNQEALFCGKYDDGHPDTSLAYYRIPWRYIEKEKGVYDFSYLDFILNRVEKAGQKAVLRFSPHAARPISDFELPEWIIKELGLPVRVVGEKNSPNHSCFYESFSNCIRAIGKYIDGDKRVSQIDMSLVGAWGENGGIENVAEKDWKMLVDAYMQSFLKTPIAAQFHHYPSLEYANTYRPVGLRLDCLGDMKWHMVLAYPEVFAKYNELWKKAPIAFEVAWVMDIWEEKGWDVDFAIEQSLLWHISTFNEKSARISDKYKDKVEAWIKKMGYRFALRIIDLPNLVSAGDTLHFGFSMQNLGVAPIYHKYPFLLRFKGENGDVYDFDTKADITSWLPGDFYFESRITLPDDIPEGEYKLQVGITDGETIVHMAIKAEEENGFNTVGIVTVE